MPATIEIPEKIPKNYHVVGYSLHGNRYINMTNRCTLRCKFCPKFNHVWDVQSYSLRLHHEPDTKEILNAIGKPEQFNEIVFCGLGESTLRLNTMLEVAHSLKKNNVTIRLNTDGLANLVNERDVTKEMASCIDKFSISLNAHDENTYNYHCRPKHKNSYTEVIDFIKKLRRYTSGIVITAIDGLAGVDISECEKIAQQLDVGFKKRILNDVG